MANPKKGLGGGLGSLLGLGDEEIVTLDHTAAQPPSSTPSVQANEVDGSSSSEPKQNIGGTKAAAVMLRLIDVCPNPLQPRKDFDEASLAELSESIRRNGVLQPILVRPASAQGKYIIIAGERRWRAARLAELDSIPAVISDADDARSAELALIENLQREDLNPVEEAEGFRALGEVYGLKQEEIAERVGHSRPAIANALRLLSLDREVLDMLAAGQLSAGHARALVPLTPAEQVTLAERIARDGLSVRQAETLASHLQQSQQEHEEKPTVTAEVDYTSVLAHDLGEQLGRKIRITSGKRKGRIEIEFYGNDDLNALCEMLGRTGGSS